MKDFEFDKISSLYSPLIGVLRRISSISDQGDVTGYASFQSSAPSYDELKLLKPAVFGGSGFSRRDAIISSMAEGLERYSTCFSPNNLDLREMSLKDLRAGNVTYLDFIEKWPFDPDQKPLLRIHAPKQDEVIPWTKAIRLADKAEAWVPEFLVGLRGEKPARFWIPTTNGCAIERTYEGACRKALLELVERDAILESWWLNQKPGRIVFDEFLLQVENSDLKEMFKNFPNRVECLFFNKDHGIPVCMAIILGLNGQPAAVSGASADLNFNDSMRRACLEAFTIFRSISKQPVSLWKQKAKSPDLVSTFTDHWIYYAQSDNLMALEQFISGKVFSFKEACETFYSIPDKQVWKTLKTNLSKNQYDVFFVNITARETAHLGLHCVRAVSLDLMPLNSTHALRAWGHRRIRESKIPLSHLNNFPHPVP